MSVNSQIPRGLQAWPWVLFEAQDGGSWALDPAELLLAQPRSLQLFKESSHQVEKQRPYLPYHVASRQFNTRAT